jgi:hypothetical protein
MKTVSMLACIFTLATVACGGSDKPPADPSSSTSAAAPDAKDADGDGVPDSADKCPDKKEDGQGPDPKDGCPKP